MKFSRHEDSVVKALLTIGLTLSAGFLLHTIYLLVDNYGASRLLREEARSFGEMSRETGGSFRIREETSAEISGIEGRVLLVEASRQELLSRLVHKGHEGEEVDTSVFIENMRVFEGDPDLRIAPVTLLVRGTYPEILAYLNRIERMDYYFHLDSVEIGEGDGESPDLLAEIKGHVFMSRP